MSDSIGYYGDGGQSGAQSAYMQNLYDRRSEWGPHLADAKHNFVASYYYELPFGRGKKFGAAWARPVDYVIGGWQMGGIFSAHTGFPLTIKTTDRSGTLARSARANVVGTPNDSHIVGPGNHWLDVSAYAQPANNTFGNSGPGVVRGPGATIFNLSLSKKFPVGEQQVVRTARRGIQPRQHAGLQQPDLADHHVVDVRRNLHHDGGAQHPDGREVLLLMWVGQASVKPAPLALKS